MSDNVWSRARSWRANRRRLLQASAGVGSLLASGNLLACARGSGSQSSGPVASSPAGSTPRQGGTLNVYVSFNPSFDPQRGSAAPFQGCSGVLSRVFRFQTGADPKVTTNHVIEPELGQTAESPDATTWTVKLRPDATFHNIAPVNGHAVEAEDIKATFQRALDPATTNPNRGALSMVDVNQIQTPDKQTVVFKLKYPYSPFRSLLASPAYSWIYPREVLAGSYDPAKVVIGSGPFTLDSAQPDVAFVYKKNPGYFEKGRPYVDAVRMAVIVDPSQQLAQFNGGNLDEYLAPIDNLEAAKQRNPKATVIQAEQGSSSPLYFQLGDPSSPFMDVRVRRAVSMSIDRDTLAKAIYQGQYREMVFLPAYMGQWALKVDDLPAATQQSYKFNPGDAKKQLEAAGHANLQARFFRITGTTGFDSPTNVKAAEAIVNMLNSAGIKTSIVLQDYAKDFVDAGKGIRQGYFDKDVILSGGVANYTEADDWLFSYFDSKSTSNQEHLADPEYDAMVDNERTIVDDAQRLKAVQDLQRYLADKMYVVGTVGTFYWYMTSPRVQNYQYTSTADKLGECYSKVWLSS
jgi:peptide/nickel transport system substrate-binding protein